MQAFLLLHQKDGRVVLNAKCLQELVAVMN